MRYRVVVLRVLWAIGVALLLGLLFALGDILWNLSAERHEPATPLGRVRCQANGNADASQGSIQNHEWLGIGLAAADPSQPKGVK